MTRPCLEKVAGEELRLAALQRAAAAALADLGKAKEKLAAAEERRARFERLAQLEEAEPGIGRRAERVDPVETALAIAITAVSRSAPSILRFLPQELAALKLVRVPDGGGDEGPDDYTGEGEWLYPEGNDAEDGSSVAADEFNDAFAHLPRGATVGAGQAGASLASGFVLGLQGGDGGEPPALATSAFRLERSRSPNDDC